jgi:hypothetical protein
MVISLATDGRPQSGKPTPPRWSYLWRQTVGYQYFHPFFASALEFNSRQPPMFIFDFDFRGNTYKSLLGKRLDR